MKETFLKILKCLDCSRGEWDLVVRETSPLEIRTGNVVCKHCGRDYPVENGILNALGSRLPEEVLHEKRHAESFGYLVDEHGTSFPVSPENIRKFQKLFLSLPEGDGSHYFQPGGSFENQAGNARRFFKTLDLLKLTGKERVLEVGASFCWSPWRFAQRGCGVVALDVTNYLQTSDLYMESGRSYFERIMADMSALPFRDHSFDLIFSHSVIHHCKDLDKLFREFSRALAPGGRVAALCECSFGIFENKSGKALQEAIEEGFNENAYTVPQWKRGALDGGFEKVDLHFFSFIEDYIERKALRKSKDTWKIRLARWIRSVPWLHKSINTLSILPRILLRPKSWMMIATK